MGKSDILIPGPTGIHIPTASISSLRALNTTSASSYPDGWIIVVKTSPDHITYIFHRDETGTDDGDLIIEPTTGPGIWKKLETGGGGGSGFISKTGDDDVETFNFRNNNGIDIDDPGDVLMGDEEVLLGSTSVLLGLQTVLRVGDNADYVPIGNNNVSVIPEGFQIPIDQAYYIGEPTLNGSVRFRINAPDFVIEMRVAGVWTNIFTAP